MQKPDEKKHVMAILDRIKEQSGLARVVRWTNGAANDEDDFRSRFFPSRPLAAVCAVILFLSGFTVAMVSEVWLGWRPLTAAQVMNVESNLSIAADARGYDRRKLRAAMLVHLDLDSVDDMRGWHAEPMLDWLRQVMNEEALTVDYLPDWPVQQVGLNELRPETATVTQAVMRPDTTPAAGQSDLP